MPMKKDGPRHTNSGQHPAVQELHANFNAMQNESVAALRRVKERVQKGRRARGIQTRPKMQAVDPRRDGESDPPVDRVDIPPEEEAKAQGT